MRILKAIYGLFLMGIGTRSFNPNRIFKNKRVAIVGPADSVFELEKKSYIDSFDFVIRINKSIVTWNKNNEGYIGTKTDLLIHNFYENMDAGGGGPLDFDLFTKRGIKYILYPKNNTRELRNVFNFYKKYLKSDPVYLLDKAIYKRLNAAFNRYRPTMGFCALSTVLLSNAKEVFITGMTFFKTPYSAGYRDEVKSLHANTKHITDQGIHNPDLEYVEFRKMLKTTSVKKVSLDSQLYMILENDNSLTPVCHLMNQ
jgi:hypothetical protein